MNAKEELQIVRTAVGLEQKRLREKSFSVIKKSLENPNFDNLVRSRRSAKKEVEFFLDWIEAMTDAGFSPPEESMRLVRWLMRNRELAFSGYNPYLLKLARQTANDVEDSGFMNSVKTLSNKFADITNYWMNKWLKN